MKDGQFIRFGLSWGDLARDVYFERDFVSIYAAPDPIDDLHLPTYRHLAAVRPIPDTSLCDLETPHGYGGPVASDDAAFRDGFDRWTRRRRDAGHVCELIRFHPFFRPESFRDLFSFLALDRKTVVVDLEQPAADRHQGYSQSTRRFLRKATAHLTIRELAPEEFPLFQMCYEAGLARNNATARYYLTTEQHRAAMAAPWSTSFVVELSGEPVGAAMFLHSGMLSHYHLGGLTPAGIAHNGLYLLLDHAMIHYARNGAKWMHLGGGRSGAADDNLLAFKARFSDLRADFHVGGVVYDKAAYEGLGGGRGGMLQSYRAP